MSKSFAVVAFGALVVAAGCATTAQFLESNWPMAVKTAVPRGQFELNCPTATGSVLSSEVIQPPIRDRGSAGCSAPSTPSACLAATSAWC